MSSTVRPRATSSRSPVKSWRASRIPADLIIEEIAFTEDTSPAFSFVGSTRTPEGQIWFDYPQAQIEAVVALVKKIVMEHDIKPDRILAHSDIAPQRKTDPGPRFPWKRLADEGLIRWPDANLVALRRPDFESQLPDVEWFQRSLSRHGFVVPLNGELDKETRNVIIAFQMKYRPANFDGTPDAETAALLDVLTSSSPPAKQ